MKKIFKLTALLLIAGAMMMTSCGKGNPDETDKLPGTWTIFTTYHEFSGTGMVTKNGSKYVYTIDYDNSNVKAPARENSFNYTTWYITNEEIFTGFIANAKSTPDSSIYGFSFCMKYNYDTEKWSYYTLFMDDHSFKVTQVIEDGDSENVIPWTKCESINLPSQGNDVTVFTDNDGSIVIRFNNDENAGIIRNPSLKVGMCGIVGTTEYEEYYNKTPIVSTYEFKKYQY